MILYVERDLAGMLMLTCKIGEIMSKQRIDLRSYGDTMTTELANHIVINSLKNAWYLIEAQKKHNQPQGTHNG
jgi:hypothetical protein